MSSLDHSPGGGETVTALRRSIRRWLAGVERPHGLTDYGASPSDEDIVPGRAWQRMLFDAGWAGLGWPREFGGRGATPIEQAAFAEEMAAAGVPRQVNLVGPDLAGPAIYQFGDAAQRSRYLEPILRGDEIWCQLFSEPEAGSDLASLRTRAKPVADGWILNGQKLWSSGAHFADLGLLLARTGQPSDRHRGLSCFILDMRLPGVEVRVIRSMDGAEKFNEVFFDSVRLPASCLLGNVDGGWSVALSTLGRERVTMGAYAIGFMNSLERIRAELDARKPVGRHALQERWLKLWVRVRVLQLMWQRMLAEDNAEAERVGPLLKLFASTLNRDIVDLAADTVGMEIAAGPEGAYWAKRFLHAPGQLLVGGTSEIQRNIIAERHLRLPRA